MNTFHTLPLIHIITKGRPHQPPIVSIFRVAFLEHRVNDPSIRCGTLIGVLELQRNIEQLKLVRIAKFQWDFSRQTVTLKLEREQVGHRAHFRRDSTEQTVTVEGNVLEETQLRNFRWDFPNKLVAHYNVRKRGQVQVKRVSWGR